MAFHGAMVMVVQQDTVGDPQVFIENRIGHQFHTSDSEEVFFASKIYCPPLAANMSFQPFGWEDEFTFLFSEGMGNMLVSRLAYLPWNMGLKHLPTLLVHLQGMAYEPCPVPSSAPYCCVPRCFREVTFMIAVWILLKWSTLMSHEFGMEFWKSCCEIVPGLHSIVSAKLYSGILLIVAFALLACCSYTYVPKFTITFLYILVQHSFRSRCLSTCVH